MVTTLNKVIYKAFGLNIISQVPLPELPRMADRELDTIDVFVEFKELTHRWNELAEPNRYYVVKENLVMFQVPNTAIYMIENGHKIIVSPMRGANTDHVRLYILGTCMGALLLQRKILPLHGSAIAINGRAYAIVGDSGAGKSTLASSFLNKGYQLLSDDVIPISLSNENIPIVTPAYPQQKLWQESLDAFGMESANYRPIFEREMKFAVPVTAQFSSTSLPLTGVFELIKTENDDIKIEAISSLERLHMLFYHTYRNFLMARLGLMEWHFHITAKIATKIEAFQLQRPINRFTANDLTNLILNKINKEE
ncbi:aldolase [Bacillus sp. FJAT-50079]|uniref:aldolase n=1 Tax=Bacillus sp. FJAT-50079 TaxID=2833577 RepID=UPI001BC95CB1|nr:aldolase [Bacillus sp. FJAT-50079]MBS4209174.1 aldolase [Bacillus sp. FJAT-50079]